MASIQVKLDSAEIRKLLKEDTLSFLTEIGESVANAAGPEYEVRTGQRTSRAVVNVVDPREDAMHREMATGKLARALGSVSR